jgi:hypothetical protein
VTASPSFDIDAFIPSLKEYLTVINPYKRQFLISWITVLDSVPDLEMLHRLPDLLEGLLNMLSDQNREIRQAAGKALQVGGGGLAKYAQAKACAGPWKPPFAAIGGRAVGGGGRFMLERVAALACGSQAAQRPERATAQFAADRARRRAGGRAGRGRTEDTQCRCLLARCALCSVLPHRTPARVQEFLIEIQTTQGCDFGALAKTLVKAARSTDEGTLLTAIRWLKEFVAVGREQLAGQYAEIIGAVLPCISHASSEISQVRASTAGVATPLLFFAEALPLPRVCCCALQGEGSRTLRAMAPLRACRVARLAAPRGPCSC